MLHKNEVDFTQDTENRVMEYSIIAIDLGKNYLAAFKEQLKRQGVAPSFNE